LLNDISRLLSTMNDGFMSSDGRRRRRRSWSCGDDNSRRGVLRFVATLTFLSSTASRVYDEKGEENRGENQYYEINDEASIKSRWLTEIFLHVPANTE